jgi:hypothetical protein
MQIPNETRKCIVFIGYRGADKRYVLSGTAFYVTQISKDSKLSFRYLVTAKHVIDKIRDRCAEVCIRVNQKNGDAKWVETRLEDWFFHPTDNEVDVAIYRDNTLSPELDHSPLPLSMFLSQSSGMHHEIGIGREVFLAGLFAIHYGERRNIPIIRVGNIAAMPEEKVETKFGLMDAYLIEARSLSGISGSPVFVNVPRISAYSFGQHLSPYESPLISATSTDEFYLLGLMHGHWDIDYEFDTDTTVVEDAHGKMSVNMGIAIVVPDSKILEVIEQPMIRKKEKEIEAKERKKNPPTPDNLSEGEGLTKTTVKE